MSEDPELLDELFPIVQTQLEMIQDNGYPLNNVEQQILNITDSNKFVEQYLKIFKDGIEEKKYNTVYDMFRKRYSTVGKIDTYVYYMDPRIDKGKNVNKNSIQYVISLVGENVTEIVLITKTPLGTGATEDLERFAYRHFLFGELQYNTIKKSMFSPKYEVLSEVQALDFLRANRMDNPEKIPKIKIDDRACKYHNLRLGQIVRLISNVIFYESMTRKKMSYRIVGD